MELKEFLKKTNNREFFVMDTETTGFSPKNADVIEISAIKVRNNNGRFEVIDTFDSYINPHYPLPEHIVEFNKKNETGICDELLSKSPDARKVVKELTDFLGNMPFIVGHNIDKFDMPFISKLFRENNSLLNVELLTYNHTFDTLTFCKGHEPGLHKLGIMYEKTQGRYSRKFLGDTPKFHNSLGDCFATLDVLDYLKNKYIRADHEYSKKNWNRELV